MPNGYAILRTIANGSKRFIFAGTSPFSTATVAALAGTAATIAGLYMVYPPLALIVPGACLVTGGVWLASHPARRGEE